MEQANATIAGRIASVFDRYMSVTSVRKGIEDFEKFIIFFFSTGVNSLLIWSHYHVRILTLPGLSFWVYPKR